MRLQRNAIQRPDEWNFNSHTPHGVRRLSLTALRMSEQFQLTHPTRGATPFAVLSQPFGAFQLTHPTRGATDNFSEFIENYRNFNSHTPHGVRPFFKLCDFKFRYFNSHTPHGVRLLDKWLKAVNTKISTHTPHTGCDLRKCYDDFVEDSISTHTPHTGCDQFAFHCILR